ncbi:nuclear transport factor 2 family protein [Sphingomonas sp. CGMCC 1.13654]|uniref:Nuclear transport factor 2 family protein n=1 Tax=Sphingomonas chungangi TaxID=2683589 RepID=A0A838L442_9SPHN|nr:nuclear transport factor 2 family protein [Sphingomonas chungangi]MBA2933680.1 nuclear transport factor 2 family protein [Sphingomonas chungangi]MVW55012.1 nuclear transport factor 2 family protein [Sphingomonas chungangi]
MSLSVQEMSDRFEIQDLLVGYCYAVDSRDFDALDRYFTPDAVIDYSEMVGFRGSLAETKDFLRGSFAIVTAAQHAVSTTRYEFDGDMCRTKTVCYNPMTVSNGAQEDTVTFGLWYVHDLVRTIDGWRIARLYEEKCYRLNIPEWLSEKVA